MLRTYNGALFQKQRHLDRFCRSLKYARIDPGLSKEELGGLFEEAVDRNRHLLAEAGDFNVWPLVTRGPGRWAAVAGPPTVIVEAFKIDFYRFARFFESGVHGVIPKTRSHSHESVDPKVKHYSRMNFNLAELEAADIDPEAYPVLMDSRGNLTEGTINSFFLVTDGVIRTPGDSDILQSVSRGTVMDLAERLGIPLVPGGAPALRPVHRRRGLPLLHRSGNPADDPGGYPSDRRRQSGPRHQSALGRLERDGGRRRGGPGAPLRRRRLAEIPMGGGRR